MIFCSNGRFKEPDDNSNFYLDTSMKNTKYLTIELGGDSKRARCYAVDYSLEDTVGKVMAFTTPSDFLNKGAYVKAPNPKNIKDFTTPRTDIAFSIDVCTWFLHQSLQRNWPRIDKDRVTQTQQPGFKGGVSDFALPVDGLRNTGLTMLHEVTFDITIQPEGHTNSFS